MLDGLYDSDASTAMDILDDEEIVWDITTTPIEFAYDNFMCDVIAHPCTQRKINEEWYGGSDPATIPMAKNVVKV